LLKIRLQAEPFADELVNKRRAEAANTLGIPVNDIGYFVFTGEASNTTYDPKDERINILFKDGSVKDISKVDNALIHHHLGSTVKKHYFCFLK
jgi:hypothetical protein